MAAQQVVDTSTRSVARERLSVILASQRGSEVLQGVDMEVFQQDIMKVVKVSAQSKNLSTKRIIPRLTQ